jgi:TetR/AcrR family transcriptional regulator
MRTQPQARRRRVRLPAAERRQEIVRAVLELARERGPDAITTQAIAERIGVTQGALFRHFPDKETIWVAVFAWVRAALARVLDEAVDDAASPLANLERVFSAHVGLVDANPGLPRVLFHELQSTGDSPVRVAVREMVADYRKRLARLIDAAKDAGEVSRDLDTALATVLFIGAVQGLVIRAALTGRDAPLANRAPAMFRLLADGYRGGAPARDARGTARRTRRRPA